MATSLKPPARRDAHGALAGCLAGQTAACVGHDAIASASARANGVSSTPAVSSTARRRPTGRGRLVVIGRACRRRIAAVDGSVFGADRPIVPARRVRSSAADGVDRSRARTSASCPVRRPSSRTDRPRRPCAASPPAPRAASIASLVVLVHAVGEAARVDVRLRGLCLRLLGVSRGGCGIRSRLRCSRLALAGGRVRSRRASARSFSAFSCSARRLCSARPRAVEHERDDDDDRDDDDADDDPDQDSGIHGLPPPVRGRRVAVRTPARNPIGCLVAKPLREGVVSGSPARGARHMLSSVSESSESTRWRSGASTGCVRRATGCRRWFGGAFIALFLAATAAFGGLATAAPPEIAQLDPGEAHVTDQRSLAIQRAVLIDELPEAGVFTRGRPACPGARGRRRERVGRAAAVVRRRHHRRFIRRRGGGSRRRFGRATGRRHRRSRSCSRVFRPSSSTRGRWMPTTSRPAMS